MSVAVGRSVPAPTAVAVVCAAVCAVLSASLLASCRAERPAAPTPLTWTAVTVPDGVRLTGLGSGTPVLVAGRRTDPSGQASGPALWRLDDRSLQPVPLRPVTYYGGLAELVGVAAAGDHVVALGRAFGGAHGLPRFTSWTGSPAAVREVEQPFEQFGGPSAIGPEQVAAGKSGDLVVGSWASHGRPAGAALWTGDGASWQRDDTDPALRSTTSDQTSASSVAVRGNGFLVGGSTTHLGGGAVTTRATVFWKGAGTTGAWHRQLLPSSGRDSAVLAVACGGSDCTVVGTDGGRLAVWRLDAGGTASRVTVDASPSPAAEPASASAAAGRGSTWVLARDRRGSGALLRVRGDVVRRFALPSAAVTAVAVQGDELVALARPGSDGGAGGALLRAHLPR